MLKDRDKDQVFYLEIRWHKKKGSARPLIDSISLNPTVQVGTTAKSCI